MRWLKPRIKLLKNFTLKKHKIPLGVKLRALMMALPVPFGDALPGLTLALFALGIIQRDGAFILAGFFGTAVCGIYLALVWTTVVAVVAGIAEWATNLF